MPVRRGHFDAGKRLPGFSVHDFHQQFPKLPTIGTETASDYSTRGIYANDKGKGYVSAYDVNIPSWAQLAEYWWHVYAERPLPPLVVISLSRIRGV